MASTSALSVTWQTWKPLIIALAVGLVLGPIISNGFGWQITSGKAKTLLHDSLVASQALICEARARADASEPGKLDYSARRDLAKKWSVMPGTKEADDDVISACAGRLAG